MSESNTPSPGYTNRNRQLKPLADPLVWFVTGVLLDAIAAGGTYAAQFIYAWCIDSRGKLFYTAVTLHVVVLLLVAASYVMFFYGTYDFYRALVK
jgi:hypothetical protein